MRLAVALTRKARELSIARRELAALRRENAALKSELAAEGTRNPTGPRSVEIVDLEVPGGLSAPGRARSAVRDAAEAVLAEMSRRPRLC